MNTLTIFKTPFCGPCSAMKPAIDQLLQEGKPITVIDCSLPENAHLAESHKIVTVPTIVVGKGNEILEYVHGFKTKEQLIQLMDRKYE